MGDRWRMICDTNIAAAYSLALDEIALDSVIKTSIPLVRMWTWAENSVTIGRFQSIHNEVNVTKAKIDSISLARRLSGGGAVYNGADDEFCYSFIFPASSVHKGYGDVCAIVKDILLHMGINSSFVPPTSLCIGGEKISGNARWMRGNTVVQHGTILYNPNEASMSELLLALKGNTVSKIQSHPMPVTGIKEHSTLSFDAAYDRIQLALPFVLNVNMSQWTIEERKMANIIAKTRYMNDAWNFML